MARAKNETGRPQGVEDKGNGAAVNYSPAELKKSLTDWATRIRDLKAERAEINASIAAIRAEAKAAGINTHALGHAIQYADMSGDVRSGYDFSYELAREAMGLPIQGDLGLGGEGGGAAVHEGAHAGGDANP